MNAIYFMWLRPRQQEENVKFFDILTHYKSKPIRCKNIEYDNSNPTPNRPSYNPSCRLHQRTRPTQLLIV
jgi:hypothetical protein